MELAKNLFRFGDLKGLTNVKSFRSHQGRVFLLSGAFLSIAAPNVALADDISSLRDIMRFLQRLLSILDLLLPIVVTLAALVFFWGMVKFIWGGSDTKNREDGKALMIWGIIALFVMISVWGLVEVIGRLFDVNQNATVTVPTVPNRGGGGFGGGGI